MKADVPMFLVCTAAIVFKYCNEPSCFCFASNAVNGLCFFQALNLDLIEMFLRFDGPTFFACSLISFALCRYSIAFETLFAVSYLSSDTKLIVR